MLRIGPSTRELKRYPSASCQDELSAASVTVRTVVRGVLVIRVASRAVCFLAAWLYLLLIVDFGVDQVWWWREEPGTPLGILGPMAWLLDAERSHLFANEKSIIFCMNLISVISQQRLVEVLARREVLLRLIGAERVMASTICLLLKGVAVACTPSKSANPIAEFLLRVAPPPACCVAIVTLRDHALPLGIAVVVAPRVTAMLGSSSCMLVGLLCGAYAAHAVLFVWYSHRGDLDSAALRLAMLVPGGADLLKTPLRNPSISSSPMYGQDAHCRHQFEIARDPFSDLIFYILIRLCINKDTCMYMSLATYIHIYIYICWHTSLWQTHPSTQQRPNFDKSTVQALRLLYAKGLPKFPWALSRNLQT